ncbi:hypothetical protein [Apilactobacillus timberlakei]|uniref:hypothetical protein n=1 Tax=Apilactobacillus timberlakei TaxID=2008380 RepID=UPI0011296BF1|nr:hypothetical protein [Apilactobacillus timberlakei]TPR16289.1 hypothetical protein DYZ95_07935 [Apilactobacillus timberlakei]TPR21540.1 hypothetical protein DY083_05835 [Apilactobacillus timberlakei]
MHSIVMLLMFVFIIGYVISIFVNSSKKIEHLSYSSAAYFKSALMGMLFVIIGIIYKFTVAYILLYLFTAFMIQQNYVQGTIILVLIFIPLVYGKFKLTYKFDNAAEELKTLEKYNRYKKFEEQYRG